MPIILPTFEVREKLTAEKMNEFRDAVEAKFSGGLTTADLSWPLVVQGNIDFADQYQIVNLRTFWNLINAAEYASLQAACDAAANAGGGCVVIPPDHTIETNGVNLNSSLVTIMGFGPSSVLKLSSGSSSGYFFRTATGGLTDIQILNVAFDGQNTGTGQACVIARRVARFAMDRVYIKNFTGPFIQITHDGVAGNSCSDVTLSNVLCTGGSSSSAQHLKVEDCDGLILGGFSSKSCPDTAVLMEPTGLAGILRDMTIDAVRIQSPTVKGISILGASGTADAKWSHFSLSNCRVRGNAVDDAYELGEASKILQHLDVVDCVSVSSGADGFVINAQYGMVTGCRAYDPAGDGIDLVSSDTVFVADNTLLSAGAYGIDASGTTSCTLQNNDTTGAVNSPAILKTTTTLLRVGSNFGDHGGAPGTNFYDGTSYTRTTTGTFGFTYTIPGGTVKVGDRVTVRLHLDKTGTVDSAELTLRIGGTSLGSTGTIVAGTAAGYIIQWDVVPEAVSGDTDAIVSCVGGPFASGNNTGAVAINWAVDNAVTFDVTVTPGGSNVIGLRHVFITINGAK